jgi:hypothetical protein
VAEGAVQQLEEGSRISRIGSLDIRIIHDDTRGLIGPFEETND